MNDDGVTAEAEAGPPSGQAARQSRSAGRHRRSRRRSWLTELVVLAISALVLAMVVKTYLVQPFRIPSQSMENTLLVGDKVLVNKLVGRLSQIHRGDIVVFDGAGSWDPPVPATDDPLVRIYRNLLSLFGDNGGQTDYIKRVIGLPGDHVQCCNDQGLVTVNGVPLHESSYLYPGSAPSTIKFSIVVPPGRLWVMGDNRGDSQDSRLYHCGTPGALCNPWDRNGTIPESMVIGRAFAVIWPVSQLRVLWVPSTFSQPGLTASAAAARRASRQAAQVLAGSGMRVVPGSPVLPLTAGMMGAVPLAVLERKIRLRTRLRRRPRRGV
jgi:signal peptidase I